MSEIVFSKKDKFSIYEGFLDSLSALFDRESQKRSWVEGDYSAFVCYDEISMCFLEASEDILTWSELSPSQHQNLQKLCDAIETYDDSNLQEKMTEKDIYYDLEWQKICEFASVVYNDLKNFRYCSGC